MKIRCKECGRKFDPEVYSGLCPRCGAYNGKRVDDSEIGQYLSSGYQGEALHRELHEAYDGGYEAAHGEKEGARSAYGDGQRHAYGEPEARPLFEEGKYALPERKHRPVRTALLLLGLVLLPFGTFGLYKLYESDLVRRLQEVSVAEAGPAENGTLTVTGELDASLSAALDAPIQFTLLEAGPVEQYRALFPAGMGLCGVKVRVACEDWPFDVSWGEVFLEYELDGGTVYRMPLERDIAPYFAGYGFRDEDILPFYCPGIGGYEEGYLFFRYDTGAQNMALLWTVSLDEEPETVAAEGRLPLKDVPGLSFLEKEGD